MDYKIDCLQYANWSEKIFLEVREGGLDAVHVTIAYHETFRETILNLERWYGYFEEYHECTSKLAKHSEKSTQIAQQI